MSVRVSFNSDKEEVCFAVPFVIEHFRRNPRYGNEIEILQGWLKKHQITHKHWPRNAASINDLFIVDLPSLYARYRTMAALKGLLKTLKLVLASIPGSDPNDSTTLRYAPDFAAQVEESVQRNQTSH